MLISYTDFEDRCVRFTIKSDGNMAVPNENEPVYTIATFGNMSYAVSCNIQSNTPAQVHVLIGNYCQIAHNVAIEIGMNHVFHGVTAYPFGDVLGYTENDYIQRCLVNKQQIIIGHDVWIGGNATIIKGVKIGNGAIIGSNAVVTKDVPPYAIVGGNPAKIIRYRFSPEIIEALDKIKWWYWPLEKVKANRQYMENVEEFIKKFGENPAVDKQKNNQTDVPPRILKKLQDCHQAGGKIFYFVPDLTATQQDARWPAVLGQFCQKYDNQRHCLLLALRQDASDHQAQIQNLQQFMGQFPHKPEPIYFGSPDGIVLELLEQADYFITTRESTSSMGIDYIETFGGHVISGMECAIYADVET